MNALQPRQSFRTTSSSHWSCPRCGRVFDPKERLRTVSEPTGKLMDRGTYAYCCPGCTFRFSSLRQLVVKG